MMVSQTKNDRNIPKYVKVVYMCSTKMQKSA
jgi:hypothetical protein